jgi:hypothetical protein
MISGFFDMFCCGCCYPDQGDLLEGIVIWFVIREGIEPIKKVSSLLLFSVKRFL